MLIYQYIQSFFLVKEMIWLQQYLQKMVILKCFALLLILVEVRCKLEQVVSMSRHGARYATNTLYDGAFGKPFYGELTAVGMRQHQNLGKLLRIDYIDGRNFLANQYTDKSIEAYSTNFNRTIQSITSQLYGLYPLGFGPKKINVPKQYNIPPFSMDQDASQEVFALPEGYLPFIVKIDDSVLITQCQNKKQLIKSNINRQRIMYDQMSLKYQPFFARMRQIFNTSSMDFHTISLLDEIIAIDKNLGRKMPVSFTQKDQLNLKHLNYWYKYFKLTFEFEQVFNTGKIKRIISDFDGRINNPEQQLKWTFLSVHDTDIYTILLVLNASSSQCVEQLYTKGKTSALNCNPNQEYASNIIFQLHFEESEYFIKIRHNGAYLNLCQRKRLSCLYKEWKSRVNPTILHNIDSVCKKKGKKQSQKVIIALQL